MAASSPDFEAFLPPELDALLSSEVLAQQVAALLPPRPEPEEDAAAAVPEGFWHGGTPAARQAAVLAMLKVVLADYLCPEVPPARTRMFDRLVSYHYCISPPALAAESNSSSSVGSNSDTAAADQEALCAVLRLYLTAAQLGGDMEGLQIATEAASLLAAPDQQAAAQRALARLAAADEAQQAQQARGQKAYLPTLRQLRYAVCHLAAESALQVAAMSAAAAATGKGGAGASAEQREAVQATQDASIGVLLDLEPENCKTLVLAALACGGAGQPPQRAADIYLSAHRLAAQQGSAWWRALTACRALAHAAEQPAAVEAGTLEAAATAFQQAQTAVRRCRRRLPPAWVQQLDAGVRLAAKLLPAAREHLQQAQAGGSGAAAAGPEPEGECGYCGEPGELRCARCKCQVYCSREHQKLDWAVHKHTSCRAE